jgi:hypothetical protein
LTPAYALCNLSGVARCVKGSLQEARVERERSRHVRPQQHRHALDR